MRLVSQSLLTSAATTAEQFPALAPVEALGHTRKGEPAGQQLGLHAQQARLLRPVQIQATGYVALAHAQRHHVHARQLLGAQAIELAPGLGIQVLHHGHGGFADQRKPARAGIAPGRVAVGIEPEHANGDDHK